LRESDVREAKVFAFVRKNGDGADGADCDADTADPGVENAGCDGDRFGVSFPSDVNREGTAIG
jgi:hypothetical protein